MKVVLIDLSGIFRAAWHATEHDEISAAFRKTLQAVTGMSANTDAVGICVDRPPYKRKEIDPEYKAHREKAPAVMHEQLAAVIDQLDRDGYHILGAQGYEADDIIGTVCEWQGYRQQQSKRPEIEIVIYSADKDMLQLVRPGVEVISSATGTVYADEAAVIAKLGVKPTQVADLLALVGDKSDGIPGIAGVGPKTAASWLAKHGSVEGVLLAADDLEPTRFREAVKAGRDSIAKSFRLAQLMTDAPINPEVILTTKARTEATEIEPIVIEEESEDPTPPEPTIIRGQFLTDDEQRQLDAKGGAANAPAETKAVEAPKQTAMVRHEPKSEALVPVSWDRTLEPRSPAQAWGVAQALHRSRIFGDWPNAEAMLSVIMTGRTMGLDAVQSLRSFCLIKGKVSPYAHLIIGLVMRAPVCEYFQLVESSDKAATYETKRRGNPAPTRLTYTFEQAHAAELDRATRSGETPQWLKRPDEMLRKTCAVQLARVVYPDVALGLYAVEELQDG